MYSKYKKDSKMVLLDRSDAVLTCKLSIYRLSHSDSLIVYKNIKTDFFLPLLDCDDPKYLKVFNFIDALYESELLRTIHSDLYQKVKYEE